MTFDAKLLDARANEYRGWIDQLTNATITDARTISATLAALNAEVIMDLNGEAVASFDLRSAAMNLTLSWEATVDGTNYFAIPVINNLTEAIDTTFSSATTANLTLMAVVSAYRRVRVRVSAFTSGTVTVSARASRADYAIYAKPIPTRLWITATGVSGAAVTATLPAPGVGVFHYITKIHLVQFVVAARTAAATPVLVTTTNISGSPIYSCDATVGAIGQIFIYDVAPSDFPMKSAISNTATTFVAPATPSVIWRWNIGYYNGA